MKVAVPELIKFEFITTPLKESAVIVPLFVMSPPILNVAVPVPVVMVPLFVR